MNPINRYKNKIFSLLLSFVLLLSTVACQNHQKSDFIKTERKSAISKEFYDLKPVNIDDKYETFYELFVYSFADSNNDGIGDFQGLIDKFYYINDGKDDSLDDLGVSALWLMPINPSPTYHKYDVLDYKDIDPQYGSLVDFDKFINLAHERGVKVIIDLVMNHTSDQHPWFKTAVEALENGDMENKYIGYYFFTEEQKSDSYHRAGNSKFFYEGKFWSGMPDLNLDNPDLRAEFEDIMRFWLEDHNVDGFRLDAVKEFDSGNDAHNIEILKWINSSVKSIKSDAYLVGEAWYGFSEYKKYYESGIDSFFDFAFAEQNGLTVKAINRENGQEYAKFLEEANLKIREMNPKAINASFISNHDTGRLAGFLASNPNKLRLAAAANIFTSGNSFIYYGEELGMRGAGRDENKRAYIYWGENDSCQTKGPQLDEDSYSYPFGSIEEQKNNPQSLLNYYKKAIRLRMSFPEISRGQTVWAQEIKENELAPIEKIWIDSEGKEHKILIIINFGTVAIETELSNTAYSNYKLLYSLDNVDAKQVEQEGSTLKFPASTVAILKEQ